MNSRVNTLRADLDLPQFDLLPAEPVFSHCRRSVSENCSLPGRGNPKSEPRNPKEVQIPNLPMPKTRRRAVV
jgi:hypothetical protein